MKKELLTKDIDWFCYHVVTDRLLTKEECEAVINAIEENGLEMSLDLFVNIVNDNGLCDVPEKLDKLKSMSIDEAKIFGFPTRSIFDEKSQAAVPVRQPGPPPVLGREQHSVQKSPTSPQPARPTPTPTPEPEPDTVSRQKINGPGWSRGWPKLSAAAGMEKEEVLKLLNDFLHKAREMNCSDVHISAGALPFVRRYKEIVLIDDQDVLSVEAAEALNFAPLNEKQRKQFNEHHDLDYGYNISENDRYRTNVMMQRQGVEGSYRIIDTHIRGIREIGFKNPEVVEKLTTYGQGLILVTGPAGSGKSTTLAALIAYLNKNRHDHIITVEDPIEVVFHPDGCNVTQRELNNDTRSFGNALRAALREDPDIIVIGELRDLETIEMAIHSSETGHLVIGTLHTSSASDTMNRVLDVFPHGQQAMIRAMLAESLKAVICQQLLPNKDGNGVVFAYEILLGTLAVSNLIREGKTFQLYSTIQTSKHLGMITMEQSHFDLYMDGKRSYEQTLPFIKTAELLRMMQQHEASGLAPAQGAPQVQQPEPQKPKKRGWFN